MARSGLSGRTADLTFYPAYCYKASPTYFSWVKLTASDVHGALQTRPGSEGQNLYFYLNHPVQFVYLVGVVVSYEDFHEKRWLLIIDDSSGATIEVTCPKPEKITANRRQNNPDEQSRVDASIIATAQQARADTMASIDIGSIVKVKGRIGMFRGTRQIQLEWIAMMPDTNAEMHFVEQRTNSKLDVLSRPWSITPQEQHRLLKAAEGDYESERRHLLKRNERKTAHQAREQRHAERIVKKYQQEEEKRKTAAEIARQAGELFMREMATKRTIGY